MCKKIQEKKKRKTQTKNGRTTKLNETRTSQSVSHCIKLQFFTYFTVLTLTDDDNNVVRSSRYIFHAFCISWLACEICASIQHIYIQQYFFLLFIHKYICSFQKIMSTWNDMLFVCAHPLLEILERSCQSSRNYVNRLNKFNYYPFDSSCVQSGTTTEMVINFKKKKRKWKNQRRKNGFFSVSFN